MRSTNNIGFKPLNLCLLNAVCNVAIYFMIFVSEHYIKPAPNKGVCRIAGELLTEPKYRKCKNNDMDENKCNVL